METNKNFMDKKYFKIHNFAKKELKSVFGIENGSQLRPTKLSRGHRI